MYKVKEWHCRPTYRKGDLEAEEVVINVTPFKTRKEAKDFIEGKLRGKKDAWRRYHRGNEKSWSEKHRHALRRQSRKSPENCRGTWP